MKEITIEIGSLFDAISSYENIIFNPYDTVYFNNDIKIKDENDVWIDVIAGITKTCHGIRLEFDNGASLECAKEHKIFNGNTCILAENINVGDCIIDANKNKIALISKTDISDTLFYDLSVDSETHLYQTTNKIIHHNTETCKALAKALKDDERALTRFDMSEYMEKHSVAKLIGAPAGYEGSERGGILTEAMRSNPSRIILFDEIEKADPAVFDIFLQILSDGRLTDNHGRTVSFADSMIIMTTNIGQSFFLDPDLTSDESEKAAKIELDGVYRPEFLNRFAGRENIVCFNRLELDSIEKIVKRELDNLKLAYKHNGLNIIVSDETIHNFCSDHYNPKYGARGLQGYVISNIEPIIVNLILDNKVVANDLELVYDSNTRDFNANFSNQLQGAA